MPKPFPKQFSANMRFLISCALTFPWSYSLPRKLESNYHVCECGSHNKRASARPAGVWQIPAHARLRRGSSLMLCLAQWTPPPALAPGPRAFEPRGQYYSADSGQHTLCFAFTATSQTRGKVQQVFNILSKK